MELEADVTVTRSAVLYRRAADGVAIAHRVLSLARQNQAAMATDYTLSTDLIDDLAEKIDAFQLVLEAPAKAIDNRAVTTSAIILAIAKSNQILTKRLNRHMEALRRSHPDFAAAYDQANVSDKRKARHGKADVSDSDKGTLPFESISAGAPLKN